MDDGQIIDLYWNRDQRAVRETDGKYGKLLHSIAWNLLQSREDSEECVNDTYLRAWNTIPPTRPEAFRTWLGQITRNLSLDRWKNRKAENAEGAQKFCWESWKTVFPLKPDRSGLWRNRSWRRR